jgi:hypothetical protein
MRRDESHITKRMMNLDGHLCRGGPKKGEMRIKGVSMEMMSDRREWKKKTSSADLT